MKKVIAEELIRLIITKSTLDGAIQMIRDSFV